MRHALLLAVLMSACRADRSERVYEPAPGKRAFSLAVDKTQTRFLSPGDEVEALLLIDTPRPDAGHDARSQVLTPRAQVLRVKNDWSEGTGLIALALTPEEAQVAALAADREDRLFLNRIAPGPAASSPKKTAAAPSAPERDQRGLAVLAFADQQEFLASGDRVDVIATRQHYKAGGKAEVTAQTILQNVVVLRAAAPGEDEEWASVQLLVGPEEANALTRAVAREDHLSFAVRAAADRETRSVEPTKMSRRLDIAAERESPRL